jgi:hypothetical protein
VCGRLFKQFEKSVVVFRQQKDHNIAFKEMRQFLPPKIAENTDHNLDPRSVHKNNFTSFLF